MQPAARTARIRKPRKCARRFATCVGPDLAVEDRAVQFRCVRCCDRKAGR